MVKAQKDKESKKLIARCLLFDSAVWGKAKELAERENRSVSAYLRQQIKLLYENSKKLSLVTN